MATKVYESETIELIDGTQIYLSPLKIFYLRQFMDKFENVKVAKGDDETLNAILECIVVAMKQFHSGIKTVADAEDNLDMKTVYRILDVCANIKLDDQNKEVKESAEKPKAAGDNSEQFSWENLKLADLEAEVFLLGIWKDYEELEKSLSMSELMITLSQKRELDYNERKFLAGIQGIDLEKNAKTGNEDPWEALKKRVSAKLNGGVAVDEKDITSFKGSKAKRAGFGIGMGLDYEKM